MHAAASGDESDESDEEERVAAQEQMHVMLQTVSELRTVSELQTVSELALPQRFHAFHAAEEQRECVAGRGDATVALAVEQQVRELTESSDAFHTELSEEGGAKRDMSELAESSDAFRATEDVLGGGRLNPAALGEERSPSGDVQRAADDAQQVQGYLAHKKHPCTLGPP